MLFLISFAVCEYSTLENVMILLIPDNEIVGVNIDDFPSPNKNCKQKSMGEEGMHYSPPNS